MFSKLCI